MSAYHFFTGGNGEKVQSGECFARNPYWAVDLWLPMQASSSLSMPGTPTLKWRCIFPLSGLIQPPFITRLLAKGRVFLCVLDRLFKNKPTQIQMVPSLPNTIICLPVNWFQPCLIIHCIWFSCRVNRMNERQFPPDVLIAATLTLWQHIETNEGESFSGNSVVPLTDITEPRALVQESDPGSSAWPRTPCYALSSKSHELSKL